jgi:hypothetical protein
MLVDRCVQNIKGVVVWVHRAAVIGTGKHSGWIDSGNS